MTMQLKFNRQKSIGQSIAMKTVKGIAICLFFTVVIFLLDKVDFPTPQKNIDKDITNEITKLK
tara:strand:- start:906 stop:1094 length:189 start_codon:yes stop_codon:yes gene_type:complete